MTSSLLILILTSVVFISESAVTVTQEKNEESGKMQLVVHGVKVEHGTQKTQCRSSWTRGDKPRTTPEEYPISDTCYSVTTDGVVKLGDYTGKSEEEIATLGESVKTDVQNDNFYITNRMKLVDSPELIVKQEKSKLSFDGVSIEYGTLDGKEWTKNKKPITTPKKPIAFQKIVDERYGKDIFSIIKKDEKYPQTLGYYIGELDLGETASFMNRDMYTGTDKVEAMTMSALMQKIEDGHLYIGSPDGSYIKTTRKLIRSKSASGVTVEVKEISGKRQLAVHGVSVEHGTQKTECRSSWARRKPAKGDKTAKGDKYPIPIGTDTCFAVTSDGVVRLGAYTGVSESDSKSAKFGEKSIPLSTLKTYVQNDNFYITTTDGKDMQLVDPDFLIVKQELWPTEDDETKTQMQLIFYGVSFESGKFNRITGKWAKKKTPEPSEGPLPFQRGLTNIIFTVTKSGKKRRTLGSYMGKKKEFVAQFQNGVKPREDVTMSTLMEDIKHGHLYIVVGRSTLKLIPTKSIAAASASAAVTAHDEYSNIYDVMYDVWHEYNMLLRDYEMHLEKEEKRERLAEILLKHKRQNILRQRKRIEAFI